MARTPFSQDELAIVRRAFARQMTALLRRPFPALEEAFATERREAYLGPPPWRVAVPPGGYREVPDPDPVIAYQDVLFALAEARGVNNGSPSLHARWIGALSPKPGDRVLHVGAGTGYYTALLARCVGESGRVLGIEVDPALAEAARRNLVHLPQAEIVAGDGATHPDELVDAVYVNASVERPAPPWLDRLAPGGRLVFPLGVPMEARGREPSRSGAGVGLLVQRTGARSAILAARSLGPAYFVRAESATDALTVSAEEREILRTALKAGGAEFVRSLRWRIPPSANANWHAGADWSLSYEEP
ncbi:protein-L-isoaspartate O-methyltransferase family protein [Salinarimonas ramus]|uniref:Protein-L-isoaspartate O-methyltransferase n=1 Tax=Salinarimonas ramus TaxID=690164 RepID=A0A917V688_9HYPH|nr:methyltransferase domain-containing protein [Salinarimonas ramus]GGK43462.1 hypothetical protein GCM10011322_33220 [Salinarimonas ramus]